MKILHQSHLAKELDQFRRGTFEFPLEFEALLFCIYLLAVNSMRSEVVEGTFSTPKSVLVTRFETRLSLLCRGSTSSRQIGF